MKTITNVEILDWHECYPGCKFLHKPIEKEFLICACHKYLAFNKSDRELFETVVVICPSCGCKIIYGGKY